MSDDIAPRILVEIRDEVRGMRSELAETRTDLAETRTELKAEIAETNRNVAIVARIVQSIDTRLERVERQQLAWTFLPRRVDALEADVADHEERIAELETDDDPAGTPR
jgi:predicted  nucleic acid-binding Zn-ribbon protein